MRHHSIHEHGRLDQIGIDGIPILTAPDGRGPSEGQVATQGFGAVLRDALRGRTAALHMLVGYFGHNANDPIAHVEDAQLWTPDRLVQAEILERFGPDTAAVCGFSLAFGQLNSPESSLAVQSWYWACRWHRDSPARAEAWRAAVLVELEASHESAPGVLERLWSDPDFAGWFRTEPAAHTAAAAEFAAVKKMMGGASSTAAASRLFAFFCARQADVRCGAGFRGAYGLFHPKVYVIERGEHPSDSVILMGSGNWSQAALGHGNVEIGAAYRVPGHVWRTPSAEPPVDVGTQLACVAKELFAECRRLASWTEPAACVEPSVMLADVKLCNNEKALGDASSIDPLPEAGAYVQALRLARDVVRKVIPAAELLPPPAGCLKSMARYQTLGAQRLASLLELEGGAILADSTGLGKTWIAMRLIQDHLMRGHAAADSVVVLVPNATHKQWEGEIDSQLLRSLGGAVRGANPIRVLGHSVLQQATVTQDHLALSRASLVVIDEAHNFRNSSSARWRRLRFLLSHALGNGERKRKVLLMTATPINNGLDDVRSLIALLKIPPSELRSHERSGLKKKARFGDIVPLSSGRPAIGTFAQVQGEDSLRDVDTYLREQERLVERVLHNEDAEPSRKRFLEVLLGRIVVRRGRSHCEEIDAGEAGGTLLFRKPRPNRPTNLRVESTELDDVLESLIIAFGKGDESGTLSLSVHKWKMTGAADAAGRSRTLLALQRVLLLKRLESSTFALLQSLLRLFALHTLRLDDAKRAGLFGALPDAVKALRKLTATTQFRQAVELCGVSPEEKEPLAKLAANCRELRREYSTPPADDDADGELWASDGDEAPAEAQARAALIAPIIADANIIVHMVERFAPRILGTDVGAWPRGLLARGAVTWAPEARLSRAAKDAKLRTLLELLVRERALGKVIVFSQFADTVDDIRGLFAALRERGRNGAEQLAREMKRDTAFADELEKLAHGRAVSFVSGNDEADEIQGVLSAFAPYYQLTPTAPSRDESQRTKWEEDWRQAAESPVDVLICTDVLSEGVNLQDVRTLVHFDLHWNPVRMIQRAGRIDRRLKHDVEFPPGGHYADLDELFGRLAVNPPRYAFAPPRPAQIGYVNLLLSEKLEHSLRLCLTIARKGLTIERTIGLDCDIGLPGGEIDLEMSQRVFGAADLEPLSSDTEDAAVLLDKADKFLAARAPSVARTMSFVRHPEAVEGDPILVHMEWERDRGEVKRASGWLVPTGVSPVRHRPEAPWVPSGAVRLMAAAPLPPTDHRTEFSKAGYTIAADALIFDRHLLQTLSLATSMRILRTLLDEQAYRLRWAADERWWDERRSRAAAYSLLWSVISVSDFQERGRVVLEGAKVIRFEGVQLPPRYFASDTKD